MKKLNVMALLACMMTMVTISGCGKSDNNEVSENTAKEATSNNEVEKTESENEAENDLDNNEAKEDASEISDEDFFIELEKANDLDTLVKKYGPVLATVTDIIAPDNDELVYCTYQDEDKYVSFGDAEYYIVGDDVVYGGYTEDGKVTTPYYFVFVESSVEEFADFYKWQGIYTVNEEEHILDKEIKDGIMNVRTEEAIEPDSAGEFYAMSYGYDATTATAIITEYKIDEATLEIDEMNTYFMVGDDKVLVSNMVLDKNAEEFTVDEKVENVIKGNDKRTVTIIKDAGTADEKVITESVEKGAKVILYTEGKYEKTIYSDAECKTTTEQILDKDQTIYLKRVAE